MNILITSAGRRSYIVKYFKDALNGDGFVHASNSSELSVAFQYADKSVITPLIYSDAYIPFLLDYCKKNNISALLSLFDIDLLVLAKNKKKFEEIGVRLIVSNEELIEICNDKWKTYLFLKQNDFLVPKTYLNINDVVNALANGEIKFPIVIKPRFGCGSISINVAKNEKELFCFAKKTECDILDSYLKYESIVTKEMVLFQECLLGQEYGADIINDLNAINRSIVIRKKIAMRSGETDIAELVDNKAIEDELRRLAKITKHIGNMDCDIFFCDNKPYILEMNARFGGGYPFSHAGGCDLPFALIKWLEGKDVENVTLRAKTGILAFKEITITKANKNK